MPPEIIALINQMVAQGNLPIRILEAVRAALPNMDETVTIQAIFDSFEAAGRPITKDLFESPIAPQGVEGDIFGTDEAKELGLDFLDRPIQTRVPASTAFDRFLSIQPGLGTPGLRTAAQRIRPLAQTQFALQPSVGGTGFDEFRDFLTGGKFLRGGDLRQRLGELARAVEAPFGSLDPSLHPLRSALQQQFFDPSAAFSAFQLPTLQQAGGVGRDLLANAFAAFQDRFFAQNPNATSDQVARQFGFRVSP